MANILYLGSTPLIDLSGYATTNYVDTAVSNVDVSDQLSNFVEKEEGMGLSQNSFTDSLKTKLESLENYDDTSVTQALNAVKATIADITLDGSVNTVIDTWTEIKNFLADFTTANDLKDVIDTVESTVETWVEAKGYLNGNDTSIYALKTEIPTVPTTVSSFTNDAGYLVANDVSTKLEANDISTFITANDVSTKLEANDVSTKVTSTQVTNIVMCSSTDYAGLTPDASTLYIVL